MDALAGNTEVARAPRTMARAMESAPKTIFMKTWFVMMCFMLGEWPEDRSTKVVRLTLVMTLKG